MLKWHIFCHLRPGKFPSSSDTLRRSSATEPSRESAPWLNNAFAAARPCRIPGPVHCTTRAMSGIVVACVKHEDGAARHGHQPSHSCNVMKHGRRVRMTCICSRMTPVSINQVMLFVPQHAYASFTGPCAISSTCFCTCGLDGHMCYKYLQITETYVDRTNRGGQSVHSQVCSQISGGQAMVSILPSPFRHIFSDAEHLAGQNQSWSFGTNEVSTVHLSRDIACAYIIRSLWAAGGIWDRVVIW